MRSIRHCSTASPFSTRTTATCRVEWRQLDYCLIKEEAWRSSSPLGEAKPRPRAEWTLMTRAPVFGASARGHNRRFFGVSRRQLPLPTEREV